MACNWLIRISSHCPNLVRIGCNAKILSRFKVYGVMHDPIGIGLDAKEWCTPAPLVPCQPLCLCRLKFCTQLWADNVFKLITRDSHIVVVRVHLDQLKVEAIYISVQEVIVKLEHPKLRQLIHCDPYLEWASDQDVWLPTF